LGSLSNTIFGAFISLYQSELGSAWSRSVTGRLLRNAIAC
jgi:hypothetical protein